MEKCHRWKGILPYIATAPSWIIQASSSYDSALVCWRQPRDNFFSCTWIIPLHAALFCDHIIPTSLLKNVTEEKSYCHTWSRRHLGLFNLLLRTIKRWLLYTSRWQFYFFYMVHSSRSCFTVQGHYLSRLLKNVINENAYFDTSLLGHLDYPTSFLLQLSHCYCTEPHRNFFFF